MVELPRGTVAFLFTDIQGSTRLWQGHCPAMERAYARHDAIVRGAVADQGGVVYKVVGDAMQAAFPTAPQAVAAVLELQLGLSLQDWAGMGLPEPLMVRMALHAGAVDPDPDGDYRSPVLNRLGRLLGAGHGGQILLSQAAAQLARDRLPKETALKDLGPHRLKDLLEPEHLYQLVHPALPADFPPPITLDVVRHNLPVQPTPVIGREREVVELTALLRHDDVRLVTLTGPGGTGKTRLALQAAAELVEDYPDGVWFVPLAALTDPGLVLSAVAGALGVRESGGTPLAELLADYLREKQLLLVLDNFEQLLGAAPAVAELIATGGVTVLVTSRAPLRLRGEREVAVPPLGLPKRRPPPTMEQMSQYAAVRLFIERAQGVRADFAVTTENAPAVAEICHRLDGLPLAIELAAARVRLLSPAAMLARLEQRLPLLTGGARDLPLRQQTLKAAIAWSYDLLTEDERRLHRRLSVFAGGWTIEAAEAVAGSPMSGELGLDVLAGMEALSEHSLVRQEEGVGGEDRFGMLETIREFGLERLAASGEAEEARQRHAAFVVDLAERASSGCMRGEIQRWLPLLSHEAGNVAAALTWAFEHPDPTWALRLTGGLWHCWERQGSVMAARGWLDQALARSEGVDDAVRMPALLGAGALAATHGDLQQAVPALELSLGIARRLGDAAVIGLSLNNLAIAAAEGVPPDRGRAIALFEEAADVFRDAGFPLWEAHMLSNLGVAHLSFGEPEAAEPIVTRGLGMARQTGNRELVAILQSNLGHVRLLLGDADGAAACLRDAIGVGWATGDAALTMDSLEGLARAAAIAGTVAGATRAARLFGTVEAARRTHDVTILGYDRELHDSSIGSVRAVLGDAAFAAAWAAGGALPLDEAVAEALALADALAAPDEG